MACAERRAEPPLDLADSATPDVREARRQAFLAEQDAITQRALAARRLRAGLVLERPTVLAFYPEWHSLLDTAALRQRLSEYEAVAQTEGWSFEERYSGEFRLTDPRSHALYAAPISRDSLGLMLAAPGYPPRIWYGEIAPAALNERLRALRRWLPGAARVTPDRL